MLVVDKKVKELSDLIAKNSITESKYHPVDRYFLLHYLEIIKDIDKLEFIYYNLENVNNTYTIQLFVCIPELFENISIEDLKYLVENFTNIFSFYAFVVFMYKYLEINILPLIFYNSKIQYSFKKELYSYLNHQYLNLFKNMYDYFEFEEKLLGVTIEQLLYVKNRLLTLDEISEASIDAREFKSNLVMYQNSNGQEW